MDQQARKKKRERFFFESFLAVSGIDATISNARDERPDADIEVAGRLVGVEITELFIDVRPKRNPALSHEEFAQRQESHRSEILQRAQNLYQKTSAPRVNVIAVFAADFELQLEKRGLRRADYAEQVAEHIRGLDVQRGRISTSMREGRTLLLTLSVLAVPDSITPRWRLDNAGFRALSSQANEAVDRSIRDKARKLDGFRKGFAAYWLLMISDPSKASQRFDLSRLMPTKISPFERTFVVELPETITEIKQEQ